MPKSNEYLEFLMEWLAPLGVISARAMFGGHCLYSDGVVFALVADNTLYLKVDGETRPRFERLGCKPFRPFKDKVEALGRKYPQVTQYYPPPAEFFEDSDVMKEWGQAAVETGRRARMKKPPR